MKAKSLLLTLTTIALIAGGVVAVSAQTGGGEQPPQAQLARSHAARMGGVSELQTAAAPPGKPRVMRATRVASKRGSHPRIVVAFTHTIEIPGNNGRFVRLVCPRKSVAINYQEATRARNVYVDYTALSPGSARKWDVGFENLNSGGKAVVKPGVVCGKGL